MSREEIVHASPREGEAVTPCCGQLPFDLPATDRMTVDTRLVTCAPRSQVEAEVRLDRLADAHEDRFRWHLGDEGRHLSFTPDDQAEAIEHLARMRKEAEATDMMRCISGEPMLYFPFPRALVPGHIYSEMGIREARISRCCEYHFDKMFDEDWVDAITGEPGDMNPDREAWLRARAESPSLQDGCA